ncbi:MAG: F0F1 ATP synthase subunit A [Anaerolineales bacterium]|nr:F0F1 ATP synthase subunit A [Anaerolineales bacterium]
MGHHEGHHETQPAVNPVAMRGCVLLLIVLAVAAFACGVVPYLILPSAGIGIAVPVITIFGEPLAPGKWSIGGWDITNTALALVLVDIIVLWIAYSLRNPRMVPKGFQAGFELIVDYLYNLTKSVVGAADAKRIFPLIATFFIMVLVANWTKLIPGFETVGPLHCAKADEIATLNGYEVHAEAPLNDKGFPIVFLKVEEALDSGTKATEAGYHECEAKYFGITEHAEGEATAEGDHGEGEAVAETHLEDPSEADRLHVTPFLRGAATDLNFTLALAVIAMVAVQYYGVQKLGLGYFSKFVNLPALGNLGKNPMGAMDFVVGLLEILSEISKIISFAFRLFGVIFAGGILLIVATFLTGALLPSAVYGLEFFIGAIQAFVFFILPLVLINLAMISHHGDEHH